MDEVAFPCDDFCGVVDDVAVVAGAVLNAGGCISAASSYAPSPGTLKRVRTGFPGERRLAMITQYDNVTMLDNKNDMHEDIQRDDAKITHNNTT